MTNEIPRWLSVARELTGVRESPGSADNPVILAWLDEIAAAYPEMASYCALYRHDSTPWCGVLAAVCMVRAGIRPPFGSIDTKRFMWANAWASDGWKATKITPKPGAVMVFTRDGGGHVAFYEDETAENYIVRGGNQSDSVSTTGMPKRQFTAAVWPPESVQDVHKLPPAGNIAGPEWERGKGSWYSQYEGRYSWVDKGDGPNSNALGVPDSKQGCAFYNRATLGQWFDVEAPNGVVLNLQQTDIGPHPRTGRSIDIAAVAAERFGYTPTNFPTDSIFKWRPHKEAPMSTDSLPSNPPPLNLPPAARDADALAELVAQKLQAKLAQPETKASMTAMLSTLFGGLVSQSPLLGVGLLLAQQLLASGGLVGTMAGSTATTTGQNVGSTGVAVIAAGVLNWIRQALTRKPGAPS